MTNNFLPFGVAGGANVIDQATFAALPARLQGFVAGVALSAQLNKVWRQSSVMAAMIGEFIQDYGALDALDDGDVDKLEREFVRTLQRATWLLGAATGTANAWTLTPVPSVAAYDVSRPMLVLIPATNTSTTVNANISGLGNRRVKKSSGSDPAVGDLVAGTMVWIMDDGTSLRVLSQLQSDVSSQIAVNKSPFNRELQTNSTRTLLNATGGGYLNFASGSYTKRSATSKLLVRVSTNLCEGGLAQNCTIARLTMGASVLNLITKVNDPPSGTTAAAATGESEFTGLASGATSWTLDFGRSDATAWRTIVNPTSADWAVLPSTVPTTIVFEESEP